MNIDAHLTIEVTDKGNVVENKCVLPDPLDLTIVRLDVSHGAESRYRMRFEDGVEGRVSVSQKPHYQKRKLHEHRSNYVVHKGWIAILVRGKNGMKVGIGFAKSADHFYVEAPGGEWYEAYLSENVVFTYSSSDTDTGQTREHEGSLPTERELLSIYADQEGLSLDAVLANVRNSYPHGE